MRKSIWLLLTSKLIEGRILPWWALSARAVLFPLDFFYWRMSGTRGYQWQTDVWIIEGVKFSGNAIVQLSKAQGEIFRITSSGDVMTVEYIEHPADPTTTA